MAEKFEPKIENSEYRASFKASEERFVTPRDYRQYLEYFSLPEEELKAKRILDIGAGLSNFSYFANEKFKDSGTVAVAMDPMYGSLGEKFEEFKANVEEAGMNLRALGKRSEKGLEYDYKTIKVTPNKVAASHQEMPFADESFDLILANNSVTQYKDREVTKKALQEAVRVLSEHGEIRIQPADLRWDHKNKSLYVSTFNAPTPETRAEADELELLVGPDREIFKILKELEETGLTFYTIGRNRSAFGRSPRMRAVAGSSYSLILRKDNVAPEVEGSGLRKLSFKDAVDDFHVPSEVVDKKEE